MGKKDKEVYTARPAMKRQRNDKKERCMKNVVWIFSVFLCSASVVLPADEERKVAVAEGSQDSVWDSQEDAQCSQLARCGSLVPPSSKKVRAVSAAEIAKRKECVLVMLRYIRNHPDALIVEVYNQSRCWSNKNRIYLINRILRKYPDVPVFSHEGKLFGNVDIANTIFSYYRLTFRDATKLISRDILVDLIYHFEDMPHEYEMLTGEEAVVLTFIAARLLEVFGSDIFLAEAKATRLHIALEKKYPGYFAKLMRKMDPTGAPAVIGPPPTGLGQEEDFDSQATLSDTEDDDDC